MWGGENKLLDFVIELSKAYNYIN